MHHSTTRTISAALLAAIAFAAHASVTCETNAMTDVRSCSTALMQTEGGTYVLATPNGELGLVAVIFNTGASPLHADRVLIRVDDGKPFSVKPKADKTYPKCHGTVCEWRSVVGMTLTPEQWQQVTMAHTVLLSPASADYVAQPIQLDPVALRESLAEMAAQGFTP